MNLKIKALLALIVINYVQAIDNPHFYRASHFFGEPRLSKDKLGTFQTWVGAGKTDKGFNCCGEETNILHIYGYENIAEISKSLNQPTQFASNTLNKILFNGDFKTIEIAFDIHQNFKKGFFGQIYLPVRQLDLNRIEMQDHSNYQDFPQEIIPANWQKFKVNLRKNLSELGINLNNRFKETGVGDLTILAGWTLNYDDTEILDYIDATLKLGALFPTGRSKDVNNVFDFPLGYDGHFAIPLFFDLSLGIFDWLTAGCYASGLIFFSKSKQIRMKTVLDQNGFIRLAKGEAKIDRGNLVSVGCFAKADHFCDGLSLLIAYRFDRQNQTRIYPCDTKRFNIDIVNTDPLFYRWQMHTLNFIIEYDFANLDRPNAPRLNLFFDVPFKGKRVFKTNMTGMTLGIDYCW